VAPGHIVTPRRGLLGEDARCPAKRTSGVEGDADVAAAALFLASDEVVSSLAKIPVDGGVVQTGPLAAHAMIMRPDPAPAR
jgi:NAD(P)-dependent dehydrogenase (short-subunit alcohol dehydrogenase family)